MFQKTLSISKIILTVIFVTVFLFGCIQPKEPTYQVTIDTQGVEVTFSKDIQEAITKGTELTFQVKQVPIGKQIYKVSIGSIDLIPVDGLYSFNVLKDSHIKVHLVDVDQTRVIFYNVMGGSNHLENPTSYVIHSGLMPLKPASKPGYTFEGWYYEDQRIEAIDTSLEKDISIKAHFIPINYTIHYELNGGSNHNDNPTLFNVEAGEIMHCHEKVGP